MATKHKLHIERIINDAKSFGQTKEVCPYCHEKMIKPPKRKSRCKSCGESIYPRENPITNKRVFLKESELETLESLRNLINTDFYFEIQHPVDLHNCKIQLAKEWGKDVDSISENDAIWRYIQVFKIKYMQDGNLSGLRSISSTEFNLLCSEKKYTQAVYQSLPVAIYLHYYESQQEFGSPYFDAALMWRIKQIVYPQDLDYLKTLLDPSNIHITPLFSITNLSTNNAWDFFYKNYNGEVDVLDSFRKVNTTETVILDVTETKFRSSNKPRQISHSRKPKIRNRNKQSLKDWFLSLTFFRKIMVVFAILVFLLIAT